jgi:DNA polymerase III epsilon subunit family exonuclease
MALLDDCTVLAVDTETTGMAPALGARLVEVAHVRIVNGVLADEWSTLVNPACPIPPEATRVHGIRDDMVATAPSQGEVARALRERCAEWPLVFHNAPFDLPFLAHLFREGGMPPLTNPIVDTLGLARGLFGASGNRLGELAVKLQLPSETAHRALGDTRTTARLFVELAARWEREKGVRSLMELAAASQDVVRATARR